MAVMHRARRLTALIDLDPRFGSSAVSRVYARSPLREVVALESEQKNGALRRLLRDVERQVGCRPNIVPRTSKCAIASSTWL